MICTDNKQIMIMLTLEFLFYNFYLINSKEEFLYGGS